MMTVKDKCIDMLVSRGMSDDRASDIFEKSLDEINDGVSGYQVKWNRPSDEYPDILYSCFFLIIKRHALEWIEENCPRAWYRPMFE